jgi:hypothetical protein
MKSKALDLFVPARLFAQFCAGRHKGVLALCLASCMLGLSGNARAQSITTFDAPDGRALRRFCLSQSGTKLSPVIRRIVEFAPAFVSSTLRHHR